MMGLENSGKIRRVFDISCPQRFASLCAEAFPPGAPAHGTVQLGGAGACAWLGDAAAPFLIRNHAVTAKTNIPATAPDVMSRSQGKKLTGTIFARTLRK